MAQSFPRFCFLAIVVVLVALDLQAQVELSWRDDTIASLRIDTILVETNEVFEESGEFAWSFRLLNALHGRTRPGVVRGTARRVMEGADTLDDLLLDETEYRLRELGIFSDLLLMTPGSSRLAAGDRSLSRDSLSTGQFYIWSEDGWSLWPEPYVSSAGVRTGIVLSEGNLFGTARSISVGFDLTDPGAEDWRTVMRFGDPALFGYPITLDLGVEWSDVYFAGRARGERPFLSYRSPFSAGADFQFEDGVVEQVTGGGFLEDPGTDTVDYSITTSRASFWGAGSNRQPSRFHAGGALYLDRTSEAAGRVAEAFENSVGVFVGLSSIAREFRHVDDYDFGGNRLVPVGGGGRISLGKISPISGGLDNVAYIGAGVFQGLFLGDLYLAGQVEAGTGVRDRSTEFTLLRSSGSLGLPIGPGTLAAWYEHSTIWNWPRHVRLELFDGDRGVRGFARQDLLGDNRFIGSLEYRIFPLIDLFFFDVGLAGFYDIGAVWDQGEKLPDTRFRSSTGLGLRFGSSDQPDSEFLRVDAAWGLASGRDLEFIISTRSPFTLFIPMDYQPPGPYIP